MKLPYLIAAAALIALPASAEVYRCQIDGVSVFSDRPCDGDAQTYRARSSISFVAPDETLPEQARAAQEFIRQRRERLAKRHRRRAESAQHHAPPAVETVYVTAPAGWWPGGGERRRPPRHRYPRPRPPAIAGNERYSPLDGPILGTRRNSAAFATRPDRSAGPGRKRR